MQHPPLHAAPPFSKSRAGVGIAALLFLLRPVQASAEELTADRHVTELFSISKSENRNRVVYAIALDDQCAPVGEAPVVAYWRMQEKGPNAFEPLLGIEQPAYGLAEERVLERRSDGGRVELTLRAVPARPLVVEVGAADGLCRAWVVAQIRGEQAYLFNVYAKLRFLGVEYLELSGWALDRSRVLRERLSQ